MLGNLNGHLFTGIQGSRGEVMFTITCWLIWKQRNNVVFNQQLGLPEAVVGVLKSMTINIYEASSRNTKSVARTGTRGKWCPPNHEWVKINADRAASKDTTWAAVAEVLHDSNGRWLIG